MRTSASTTLFHLKVYIIQKVVFELAKRGAGAAAQKVTHLPVGSGGFRKKTAVFSRRDGTDCLP